MMSSSEQAFLKLDEWRRSNTVLKLTMLADGEKPEIKFIQIVAVDQITSLVGFLERGKRVLQPRLDLSKAAFEERPNLFLSRIESFNGGSGFRRVHS